MRILTAIVTHNRSALLARCLDHVAAQERDTDAVLVIDNASTDDTLAMLAGRPVTVITQPNVGPAGGWHRAMAFALEQGFDAIWLMDDDGFPDPAALGQLEAALQDDTVSCASSVVVCEEDRSRFVFPFPRLDAQGLPVLFGLRRKLALREELAALCSGGTYPFAHFFNGALIRLASARRIGNIERDFVIFGDEVDYFFRLRTAGRVISVLDARHYHPDVGARPYTPMKIHYYIKNSLILHRRYFTRVWLRNAFVLGVAVWRVGRRNSAATAASMLAGRMAPGVWRAVAAGLRGKPGADFRG